MLSMWSSSNRVLNMVFNETSTLTLHTGCQKSSSNIHQLCKIFKLFASEAQNYHVMEILDQFALDFICNCKLLSRESV